MTYKWPGLEFWCGNEKGGTVSLASVKIVSTYLLKKAGQWIIINMTVGLSVSVPRSKSEKFYDNVNDDDDIQTGEITQKEWSTSGRHEFNNSLIME